MAGGRRWRRSSCWSSPRSRRSSPVPAVVGRLPHRWSAGSAIRSRRRTTSRPAPSPTSSASARTVASIVQLVSSVLVRRGRRARRPAVVRGGLVPRRGRRQPAPLADPLGPLRDAAAPAGRLPARGRPLVGAGHPARDGRPARSASRPPIVYPIAFWVALLAVLFVGARARTARARRVTRRPDRERPAGAAPSSAVSALIYWLANREFDAGRGDFFYLADAFLHGRTWLDIRPWPVRRHPRRTTASTSRSRPSRPWP